MVVVHQVEYRSDMVLVLVLVLVLLELVAVVVHRMECSEVVSVELVVHQVE